MPKAMGMKMYIMTMVTTMPIQFSTMPALNMSGMRMIPEPNTMALGGVATGRAKARDAPSPALHHIVYLFLL